MYQRLFDSLEEINVKEDVYVFTDRNYNIDNEYSSNIYISKSYDKIDRFLFHLKHTKVLNDIQRKLKINNYTIMHAHSLFSNGYIAYKLNQKYKIPYIVAVRNTDINIFFKKMIHLRRLGIKIFKNAEKIVFLSESYKEYTLDKFIPAKHKKEIKNKAIVIPNGIDKFWLNNKAEESFKSKYKKTNLIYVGNIDSNKNIETTVKTCKLLIEQGYKVNYKVIGKVKNKNYMNIIEKYEFIKYIPYCQKEELIEYYRNSDIFIMPSKHETFGLVYAEAMSQGLPVIYTRGQGFDGQFNEGEVGYSVDCMDEYEIADKILKIKENYSEISNRCIKLVDRFDWDNISELYSEVYD
ncbi:glycosyltransferase family 4 protein [Clostridium sp. D2Q-14]|uniref:glycosyltransferase family 4 protein n=1 Tax=Anaeromonas gelatinilytica TaxID=2683194 RepID=UPI00193C1A33|nr:glycosyltransferase family 4 protein [Anaeromonas gelatinilytica]MBS4534360.1 glycosyltransferase family 4 protein [Anaeromonas gelatinilytica]